MIGKTETAEEKKTGIRTRFDVPVTTEVSHVQT